MSNILSIQSAVAYGHVGNSAAVFPLQRIGHEVWPVYTVNYSNHTGYGEWGGPIIPAADVDAVLAGTDATVSEVIESEGCEAVLPGLMWFVHNALTSGDYNWKTFGTEKWKRFLKKGFLAVLQQYQKPVDAALDTSQRFEVPTHISRIFTSLTLAWR